MRATGATKTTTVPAMGGGHKQQSTKGYEAAKEPAVAAAAVTAAKMT